MRAVGVLIVALAASAALAGIYDNFDSYPTGSLFAGSGGVWRGWENVGGDAQIVTGGLSAPNALQLNKAANPPDVVTYSNTGNVLGHLGAQATFSFDFRVSKPDNNDIDSYFYAGSGNPNTNDTFYDSLLGIFIVDWGTTAGPNATSLTIWDGRQSGGPFGTVNLNTALSLNAWHDVRLQATQTVADMTSNPANDPDGNFVIYLDNVLVTANPLPFIMSRPEGLNAFEAYEIDSVGASAQYHMYDNVSLTPEPAALGLLALGLLLRRR